MTPEEARQARLNARREIVQAANRRAARTRRKAPYTMRHLQRCVCVVRRHRLVKPHVLELAGFNRKERR